MSAASAGGDVSSSWQAQQMKAFGRWAKLILAKRQISITSIEKDFTDGIALWHLIDELSSAQYIAALPHPRGAKDRIQAIDNLNLVFALLRNEGIRAVNVSEVDIADGNVKLTLGLLWIMIQKYAIGKVTSSKDAASATVSANSNVQKNALLSQLRDHLKGMNIGNNPLNSFKDSFQDGLVFCALIHKADPKLIDFSQLTPYNKQANLQLAFNLLEKHFNIPNLLDVEDVLSAQPDERSMMTFVAHVFNCLLHPQETKATKTPTPQLVPTHKKGKFQELMGQVGISPDELDAPYVPAPGSRPAKLERSNTGTVPSYAHATHSTNTSNNNAHHAPLARSFTVSASLQPPVSAATSSMHITPPQSPKAPAVKTPPSVAAAASPPSPPGSPPTAPGVGVVQFIKESLNAPTPMNTDTWEVLSKTAITHTAISIQQCESPTGSMDALCAAFGEVMKVCRIVAGRQDLLAGNQLLDCARVACNGLSSFAEQRYRGVSPDTAKTVFLEPLQSVLRALKPWFESQKKKQSEAELASRPISAAIERFTGLPVPTGEDAKVLARKAVAFVNQVELNMNMDPTCVVLAITAAEAIDTARLASAAIPGGTASVPPLAQALASSAIAYVNAKIMGIPLPPFATALSSSLQSFSTFFNGIIAPAANADEAKRAQEAAEKKRAEELRQIDELRRLEEELLEEESMTRKRIEDQKAEKAAQQQRQREEEANRKRVQEQLEEEARRATEMAKRKAEDDRQAAAARRRDEEQEEALRRLQEEAEQQQKRDEDAQRQRAEEEAAMARKMEEDRQRAAEEERLRLLEQQRQEREEAQRILEEEERKLAEAEEAARREAEEERLAAEAETRRLEALAAAEEENRRKQEADKALQQQSSLEASMAAIRALEEEEAHLRRDEEEARLKREALQQTRQRAESQQDDLMARKLAETLQQQDQFERQEHDEEAARLEEERIRRLEAEEERRRQRDEDERREEARRAQEEKRIQEATRLIEEAGSQLGSSLPLEGPLARMAQEAEGCMITINDLPPDAHAPLAQQVVQLLLITRKVSSAVPSGHLLEAARTVAKHACRYLASHTPTDDPEEAEQQKEISKRGLSFGLQTLIAALTSACSKEPAPQSAPSVSPEAQRAAEQIEAIAANIGRNPALVAVNFDGIFENIKQHIPALDVQRLRSPEDITRYVGAVAAVAQATEQVAGIEPEPLRRQQLLDLARSAAAVSIRLLVGEQAAQAENIRALNTTLQALFGLMKAVIHQSGPQADDEAARQVREAAERVEKGQTIANPPADLLLRSDEIIAAIERAIDLADFSALAPVAASLLDVAGVVLSRRPNDLQSGQALCRSFAAAAISFLRLSRRKTTGSLRGQTPSPVALQNEGSQLHAWIAKSLPPPGLRSGPDMDAALKQIEEAIDKLNRMTFDVEGSLSDLKDYAARAAAKLDSYLHEISIDATPLDKLATTIAKLMDVAVSVASRIPSASGALEWARRLSGESNAFFQLCKNRNDEEAMQQRASVLHTVAQLNTFVQTVNVSSANLLAAPIDATSSPVRQPSPPLQQNAAVRDNAYLDEGLNTINEGRTRFDNRETDIEGELQELVAISSKRRAKLADVLKQSDLDQLDYLRLAELIVELVETNTAIAKDQSAAADALHASSEQLLNGAKMLMETSRCRRDEDALRTADELRECLGSIEALHKEIASASSSSAVAAEPPLPSSSLAPNPFLAPAPSITTFAIPDSPRAAESTPRVDSPLSAAAAQPPAAAMASLKTSQPLNTSQSFQATSSPRSKTPNERAGPPDPETLKAIQELVKLTMAELSRVDAPGQKNNEDPQMLYERVTAAEQAMERHMNTANRNTAEFYVGTGVNLRELLSAVKALLNTDAFDDAVKRKRVAEAAKEVGNALFKFTYLKKANDTEGTLDTAQSAIGNTLRSLLLQLKPGPMLKRNLTPAAVIAAEMERPVPLTPTPTLPTQTMPVAPVSPSSPAAKNEDILKSIQEGLRIILEVIEGINGPAVPSPDATEVLVARVESMTQAIPPVIRVDGSQRTDYVQLAQLVAGMIDTTRTVASREDDQRKRQLLDAGRALGNALLKFIYSRKSGAPIDDAQRLLQSFITALLDSLRKSTGKAASSSTYAVDPLASAIAQALEVVTEGNNLLDRPLATDIGRDPQRSLEQARLNQTQVEEAAQLSSREDVIHFANNAMSMLDICRGLSARAQPRDKLVASGKRFGNCAIDYLNARRGGDRRADEMARVLMLQASRELLDALMQSQAGPAPMFGSLSSSMSMGTPPETDAALRTLRAASEQCNERLPSKGKLEMEETCATAEELAAQALIALRQNRPPTRLADLVAELVDLARSLPMENDLWQVLSEQSAAMCRCAISVVEHYPRRNDSPELPTAIRRVVDGITDFARRKKTALNPDPYVSVKPAAEFDLPAKIITEALDKIGKPIYPPYQDDDLSRTGTAVMRLLESEPGPDPLMFAKAIDALVDAGRAFGALMQMKAQAASQPARPAALTDPSKPRKVGVFKKSSQAEKKSRTGWKERLICLHESHLAYYSKPKNPKDYENPPKKDLKGTIELKDATASESQTVKEKKLVVLELRTPRAKKPLYFIQMPSKEAMDDWIRAINLVIEQSTTSRRPTAVKPPYEGPLILAETRAIANDALTFVQLLKEREKREQLLRLRNVLLDSVKKLAAKKTT